MEKIIEKGYELLAEYEKALESETNEQKALDILAKKQGVRDYINLIIN